ncbi:probable endochitinase [Betta splendens]|uniref:chitinase n=1 Tax=Betta splendens TaxID=158456 RepID=A0A9W2Y2Y0_BETSP|nr:probable endochitinase [Betta splendens]
MYRMILTAGLCLIIASLARTTSASCISTSTNGCPAGFCTGRTDGNYINAANPNSFYQCSNQLTYSTPCPASGLVYRAPCDCCDYPNNPCPATKTTSPTTTPYDPYCQNKQDGYYCYTNDYSKYYWCVGGRTYIMPCPQGTIFTPKVNNCVRPENA